jgi:hypothetical protein
MSEANKLRKQALECLRLQTDCMQLAGDALDHKAQKHFLRMAGFWSTLAVSGLKTNTGRRFSEAKTLTT